MARRGIGAFIAFLLLWSFGNFAPMHAAPADATQPTRRQEVRSARVQSTCAPVQLIQDGGFEAGTTATPWQTQSSIFSSILDDSPNPAAHSGTWKAWMGGADNVTESLWQSFTVPAGVLGLKIKYWWRVDTLESTHPFDFLEVWLRDAAGAKLGTQPLETLTDGDASSTWQQSSLSVNTSYANQTIQLAFLVTTDPRNPTSFFIDDVSVYKTCPAGLAADVTGDCKVSITDIQEIAAHWGETNGSACYAEPYDQVNAGASAGRIDAQDISQAIAQWRQTAP